MKRNEMEKVEKETMENPRKLEQEQKRKEKELKKEEQESKS